VSLRISATTVESYHLYRTTDWMTEERFVQGITEFEPTPQIQRGMAFESVLRDPDRYLQPEGFVADGIVFPRPAVERALAHIPDRMIWQAKATKVYTIEGEPVTVVAKTDGQVGRVVVEVKTTEHFDLDRYEGSRQWRLYLDIFEADACRYVVYVLRESKRDGEIYLAQIEEFDQLPYDGLRADVLDDVRALVSFIHLRGLERHFGPREDAAFV
jgi:hypothetical protein